MDYRVWAGAKCAANAAPQSAERFPRRARLTIGVVAFGLLTAIPCAATPITFDFNSMTYNSSSSPGSNTAVQTYMRGVWTGLGQSGSVNVSGAGMLSNNNYTGDGHVVGPTTTCKTYYATGACKTWNVTPATLGNTNGGVQGSAMPNAISTTHPDNYLVNNGSDRIVITLPHPVYYVSFDFEIFPDGTCPTTSNCGTGQSNLPDFDFLVGNSIGSLVSAFPTVYGTSPGVPGTYSYSTNSGGPTAEKAPQYLGVSGDLFFNEGITMLAFVDWPQRIGIDNLVVDTDCRLCAQETVPEPSMLPIVALGFGIAAWATRRRTRA